MAEYVLTFEPPAPAMSMNDKEGRGMIAAKMAWRDRAYYAWCEMFPARGPAGRAIGPAEVFTSLPFERANRRDPINFARTVKAIVDGITRAGAWPDDTPDFVTQHIPALRVEPRGLVVIRVVERNV